MEPIRRQKFNKIVEIHKVELPKASVPAVSPLPTTVTVVLAYPGWLQEQDAVHHGSLQLYMTAINTIHVDGGFERPAIGKMVTLARFGVKGLSFRS